MKDKDLKDHIEFIDNGYCLKRRVIFLDKVSQDEMDSIIRIIMMMEELSKEPITIYINTYGGSVYDGLSLYDYIRESSCWIRTIATGKVMSMGVILFLSGDERIIKTNARFMMHSVGSGTSGRLEDQEADVEETRALTNRLVDIISERTNLTLKQARKITNRMDYFFGRDEAIDKGFSDDGAEG